MLLDNTVAVVIVSSDFVSVYTYAVEEQDLYQKAGKFRGLNERLRLHVEACNRFNNIPMLHRNPDANLFNIVHS